MAAADAAANATSDPGREAPPPGGDGSAGAAGAVGGYNFFWLDFGNQAYPIDGQYRTSVLTDPPNGRMPELTEAGKARRATVNPYLYRNTGDAWWIEAGDDPYDGPETLTPGDRCIYTSVATTPVRSLPYNNLKTITQTQDHVVILVEWMHWAKVVRLDAEHAPPEYRSMGGDSIGWWEGDTLVVETTNFLDSQSDPRDGLKVIERFQPPRPEGPPLRLHRPRHGLRRPLQRRAHLAGDRRPPLRVRLPRRQLRDGQHPPRRPAAGEGVLREAGPGGGHGVRVGPGVGGPGDRPTPSLPESKPHWPNRATGRV